LAVGDRKPLLAGVVIHSLTVLLPQKQVLGYFLYRVGRIIYKLPRWQVDKAVKMFKRCFRGWERNSAGLHNLLELRQ